MKFRSAPERILISCQVDLDVLNNFKQIQEKAKQRQLKITLGDAMEEGMRNVVTEFLKLVK
jgi:hypothetical protein